MNTTQTSFNSTGKVILYLSLIVIFAFALRIGRCFAVTHMDKDSVMYIGVGKKLAHDGIKTAFEKNPRIPPLYVFTIACGEYMGIDGEFAGRAVSVIAGTLLTLAAFMVGWFLFKNTNLALISAFLTAVHPFLIVVSEDVMRDSLFAALIAFSLAFALMGAEKWKLWQWGLSGLFAGLATLTRSEGSVMIFAIPIWIVVELFVRRSEFKKTLLKSIPSFFFAVFIFCLCTFPVEYVLNDTASKWVVFDKRIFGYLKSVAGIEKSRK